VLVHRPHQYQILSSVLCRTGDPSETIPEFIREPDQHGVILFDEPAVTGIGEGEPDRKPRIDTEGPVRVRVVQRSEAAHEGLSFGIVVPLRKERMTEGVGVPVGGTDAPSEVPERRTRRRGCRVDGGARDR